MHERYLTSLGLRLNFSFNLGYGSAFMLASKLYFQTSCSLMLIVSQLLVPLAGLPHSMGT